MFFIEIVDKNIVLDYFPRNGVDFINVKFREKKPINIANIFKVYEKDRLQNNVEISEDDSSVKFIAGKLIDNYWTFDKVMFGISHDICITQDYSITENTFRTETNRSVFKEIDKVIQNDLYVGGSNSNSISVNDFDEILKSFPTGTEIDHYISSRISTSLQEYFIDTKDYTQRLKKYREKRVAFSSELKGSLSKNTSSLRETFQEVDHDKYSVTLEILKEMLSNSTDYNEKDWQKAIINVLLILFPKYITVLENVKIKDIYHDKNRYLDFLLVDTNGNCDIIEIKQPFDDCIVSKRKYRDNYIPYHELSGAVMQTEKYIFNMNKWGKNGEEYLNSTYKDKIPKNVTIKLTNPKALLILGRSNTLNLEQFQDFEIIKRKYSNILDIITYDDLVARFETLLGKISV